MAVSGDGGARSRLGGLVMILGIVLSIVSVVIQPGGPLLDSVDQTDFAASLGALADAAALAHLSTLMALLAMLCYVYSFFTLLGLSRQAGFGDRALRGGLVLSMFGWGLYLVAMGMRHMSIHLMQRGGEFEDAALAVYTTMAAVILVLVSIYPIATFLAGWGIASRFRELNLYKLAGLLLAAVGALAYVNFLVVLFWSESADNVVTLLTINSVLLWIGSVGLLITGIGMYQGREELTSDSGGGELA